MNNWKNGRITGMSSACQFADDLQDAHAERMRRQRAQERYNEEAMKRLVSNLDWGSKILCGVAVLLAIVFIIGPAVYEIWIR